jgi:GalNAc-alpha-(1->4)-GalNAc-alpha-(1->3)-diNAcBac-PP-undecaprenol alpha-1,4-N-acetyl-D-galactosaminyltransferase
MSKYKIMFTIDTMGSGGAERVISVLANQFVREGHEVLITQLYSHKCDYELDDEIKLNCVAPINVYGLLRSLKTIQLLRKHIQLKQPDIIISFLANINIYTIIASRGCKIPIIVSERNDPNREPAKKALKILRSICYLFADGFVFQAKEAQEYFNNHIQRKSCIIYNPLVEGLPVALCESRSNKIVSVCRLSKQKNLKLLFDAFELFNKKYRGYHLVVYGEGEQRKELENYIKELNASDRISLPGYMTNVHEKIKNSCMFVLSSDYEGMPNALLEAMAIGIPVISTDCPVGGPREFIKSYQNGILVPISDIKELAKAMEYIVLDPNRANIMAKKAMSVRDVLSVQKVEKEWFKIIEKVSK